LFFKIQNGLPNGPTVLVSAPYVIADFLLGESEQVGRGVGGTVKDMVLQLWAKALKLDLDRGVPILLVALLASTVSSIHPTGALLGAPIRRVGLASGSGSFGHHHIDWFRNFDV
jgi:hypothetical protein